MSETYDPDEARKGETFKARLLRSKDEVLGFTMDDIHKALEGDLPREKYDQELMPLFLSYMEATKKLDKNETDEAAFNEGIDLLNKLQAKAVELGIPGAAKTGTNSPKE